LKSLDSGVLSEDYKDSDYGEILPNPSVRKKTRTVQQSAEIESLRIQLQNATKAANVTLPHLDEQTLRNFQRLMNEWQLSPVLLGVLVWLYLDGTGNWQGWGFFGGFRKLYADSAVRQAALEKLSEYRVNDAMKTEALPNRQLVAELKKTQERIEQNERDWREVLAKNGEKIGPHGVTKEQIDKFGCEFERRRGHRAAKSA
jgi:hypothetical protein